MQDGTEILITDDPVSPLAQAERERESLTQLCRMSLQQFEFQLGKRRRGWDLAFLMGQLQTATTTGDSAVDEVQQRMDEVVNAAVEWHQSDDNITDIFDKAGALGDAIDSLLELREKPQSRIATPAPSFQPPNTCPDCIAGTHSHSTDEATFAIDEEDD